MPIKFTDNADQIVALLRQRASQVGPALLDEMTSQMQQTADYSRATKLSGDPLKHRTGQLSRSITSSATLDGLKITGKIGSSAPYAHVHELGGVFLIPEHYRRTGFGSKQQRITMLTRSGSVRAAVKSMTRGMVRAHNATYPQRAFLKPSLMERRDDILAALRGRLTEVLSAT